MNFAPVVNRNMLIKISPIKRRASNKALTVVSYLKASFAEVGKNAMLIENTSINATPIATLSLNFVLFIMTTLKFTLKVSLL